MTKRKNSPLEPTKLQESTLIFISHDSRDAELAEAFSKLLKAVSAGMLKSFRASDKKGNEGIEFGDEWYKALMSNLESASDVVCLLTERSIDRPWILFEAGVAKGKLETPVHGLAIGVPLERVSTGPFYQFQNSDDSADSLSKLVLQLCKRVNGLEPDKDIVAAQVEIFKNSAAPILKKIGTPRKTTKDQQEESSIPKLLEEMKFLVRELPMRLEKRMACFPENQGNRAYLRRIDPGEIDYLVRSSLDEHAAPISIILYASFLKNRLPWVFDISQAVYNTIMSGNTAAARHACKTAVNIIKRTMSGELGRSFSSHSMESEHLLDLLRHSIMNCMEYLDMDINKKISSIKNKK
jgi:hypothetical protein